MLNADYKLVPVPAADYIAKHAPKRYIRDVPNYAVFVAPVGQTNCPAYQRAYAQVVKLYDLVVKWKAANVVSTLRWRANKSVNVREK